MKVRMNARTLAWRRAVLCTAAVLVLAWVMPRTQPLFAAAFPELPRAMYLQEPFLDLLARHAGLVLLASAVSLLVALVAGVACTRPAGRALAPLLEQLAAIGQTVPPVAVLALAVPVLGFGTAPVLIALMLYGFLPVLHGVLGGLGSVPQTLQSAARAQGLSAWQCLWRVELPLAAPVILAGLRSSVAASTGTATLAATVGVPTLGAPIILGLTGFNTAYIVQGAVLAGGLAIALDQVLVVMQRRWEWLRV